jgi:hypothetical protein
LFLSISISTDLPFADAQNTINIGVFVYDNSSLPLVLPNDYYPRDSIQLAYISGIKIWSDTTNTTGIPIVNGVNTSYIIPVVSYYNLGGDAPTVIQRITSISISMQYNPSSLLYNTKVVIPPMGDGATTFMQICETTKQCLVLSGLTSSDDQTKCTSRTAECANKYIGQRRFDFTFQTLSNYRYTLQEFLNWGWNRFNPGAEISIYYCNNAYGLNTLGGTNEIAGDLNYKIIERTAFNITNAEASQDKKQAADTFFLKALDITRKMNPDVLAVIGDLGSGEDCKRIIKSLYNIGWVPNAVVFGGGCLQLVNSDPEISNSGLQRWMFGIVPWDDELKGFIYKPINERGNWEQWDSPKMYADSLRNKYGTLTKAELVVMGVGTLTMMILQKGIEQLALPNPTAQQLQQTIGLLYKPSFYGLIAFDQYGRVVMSPQNVIQIVNGAEYQLITPYSVGKTAIYPFPQWNERNKNTDNDYKSLEITVTVLNCLVITAIIATTVLIIRNRKSKYILASTPSFCVLILFGALVFNSSIWLWNSKSVINHSCLTFTILIHLGFDLIFYPLFLKTYRLYCIFNMIQIKIKKISNLYLLTWLSVGLLVDAVLLTLWHLISPIQELEVIVDPYRPYYNYTTCSTDNTFIIFTLCMRGVIFAISSRLTWKIRNFPENFNESLYIGLSMLMSGFIFVLFVTILMSGVGSIDFQYIIRSIGIILFSTLSVGPLSWSKVYYIYCEHNGVSDVELLTQNNNNKGSLKIIIKTRSPTNNGVKKQQNPIKVDEKDREEKSQSPNSVPEDNTS